MRGFERYAIRLLLSMSLEDAKEALGFPRGSSPSPGEIQKAYRSKAIENHPDRGGSHTKMVEINVAKEILEGKRREDRTPYKQPEKPKKTPEQEAQEHFDRMRQQAIKVILEEASDVQGYLDFALRHSAPDLTQGGTVLVIKDFLTEDFAEAVDKIHDEVEASKSKDKDWQTAGKLCTSLGSKALRLASKFGAIRKKREALTDSLFSEGATLDEVRSLVTDTAKFIADWDVFLDESGRLSSLINTSEAVPLAWDDLYTRSHQVIYSFHLGFKANRPGSNFQDFEKQLKTSVATVDKLLGDFGEKAPSLKDWRTPGDYKLAVELIKKAKVKTANSAMTDRVASRFAASR